MTGDTLRRQQRWGEHGPSELYQIEEGLLDLWVEMFREPVEKEMVRTPRERCCMYVFGLESCGQDGKVSLQYQGQ